MENGRVQHLAPASPQEQNRETNCCQLPHPRDVLHLTLGLHNMKLII